jgi:hypothetical protein
LDVDVDMNLNMNANLDANLLLSSSSAWRRPLKQLEVSTTPKVALTFRFKYNCGALVQHPSSPNATALNPTVLIEVTSDSSEGDDTGTKLEAYQTNPSRVAISGGKIRVDSVGAELVVEDIYRMSSVR